jgi:hypothetical protein
MYNCFSCKRILYLTFSTLPPPPPTTSPTTYCTVNTLSLLVTSRQGTGKLLTFFTVYPKINLSPLKLLYITYHTPRETAPRIIVPPPPPFPITDVQNSLWGFATGFCGNPTRRLAGQGSRGWGGYGNVNTQIFNLFPLFVIRYARTAATQPAQKG